MTQADVQTSDTALTEAIETIAGEAGCTEECKILSSYSIRNLAFTVWHGTPRMKAETYVEDVIRRDGTANPRLAAWLTALHAAEATLDAD